MKIWRVRIECWIPKATNTHSNHVKLTAFQLDQWLRERAPLYNVILTLPVLLQTLKFFCKVS